MGYTIYDGSDGFLETALVDDQIVPAPFTDGSGPLDPATECTGYRAGWLGRGRPLDRIPVIHIHRLPEFWDNTTIAPDSTITFATTPIRYISLGSYGPVPAPPIPGTSRRSISPPGGRSTRD